MDQPNIIVICGKCGQMADYTPPDLNNPWGTWHWHQPCQYCGSETWFSHDINRDIKTGKTII